MAVAYHVLDLPDDLPPGEYDTTIVACDWVKCRDGSTDLLIIVRYNGELDGSKPRYERGLFHFTKIEVVNGHAEQASAT